MPSAFSVSAKRSHVCCGNNKNATCQQVTDGLRFALCVDVRLNSFQP